MIIGFGIGVTTSAVAQHPLENIDCVEICPGVKEAAPLFEKFNQKVWQNPKVNFIAGDGRNYLLLTKKKYDIISCDPVHPGLGSGSLYSKEYFELCKNLVKPGGVISQYLPLHKLTLDDLKNALGIPIVTVKKNIQTLEGIGLIETDDRDKIIIKKQEID